MMKESSKELLLLRLFFIYVIGTALILALLPKENKDVLSGGSTNPQEELMEMPEIIPEAEVPFVEMDEVVGETKLEDFYNYKG